MHQGHFATIPDDECWELLRHQRVGRLAWSDGAAPVVVPVTFVVEAHAILFRTNPGSSLGRLRGPAAFQVDDVDVETESGWSVLARGDVGPTDQDAQRLEPWAPGPRSQMMALRVDEISGRAVSSGAEGDADVYA